MSWLERAAALLIAALLTTASVITGNESSPPAPDTEAVSEYSEQLPEVQEVYLDPSWEFADRTVIHTGAAVLYRSQSGERKDITVGVNAGHGTEGGSGVYVPCHPDYTPKVTGGSTSAGAVEAMAVAVGMTFNDGTPERDVTLRTAVFLKELLLASGYDVLMIRDGADVQLDNIARTVLANNLADCHVSLHWDGDGLDYDKGIYYMAVPEALKGMYPVSEYWQEDDRLGECLVQGLAGRGLALYDSGFMQIDLVQTSYSKVPSVDIELGNQCSSTADEELMIRAEGLRDGIDLFYGY